MAETEEELKKKYRVEYNRRVVVIPILLVLAGGYLFFSPTIDPRLRLLGGLLLLASGVAILSLAIAFIQVKAMAIFLEEKAKSGEVVIEEEEELEY